MRSEPDAAAGARQAPPEVVDRLADLLPAGALHDVARGSLPEELRDLGGLPGRLAGRIVEAALEAEMSEHLGHPPGGRPQGANLRNGTTSKTVQTELGPVEVNTPRDRDGSFSPRILPKRRTRLAGLDDWVLWLFAGEMTDREVGGRLDEIYGAELRADTRARVTGAVLADVRAWRTRALDPVYPIVRFDALRVKVREDRSVPDRRCLLALGLTCDGERDLLGIWPGTEGPASWIAVLDDLRRRGVDDIVTSCADGLEGCPEAIEAAFPQAWVQTGAAGAEATGPRLWTIGYERLLPPELIAELEAAGVERLLDVRFRPQSRRPGMSMTRLGTLLGEHGIAYEHRRALGTPPEIRWCFKHGRVAEGRERYAAYLRAQPELAVLAAELSSTPRTALLCLEADPAACHRRVIAELLAERLPGLQVTDL